MLLRECEFLSYAVSDVRLQTSQHSHHWFMQIKLEGASKRRRVEKLKEKGMKTHSAHKHHHQQQCEHSRTVLDFMQTMALSQLKTSPDYNYKTFH